MFGGKFAKMWAYDLQHRRISHKFRACLVPKFHARFRRFFLGSSLLLTLVCWCSPNWDTNDFAIAHTADILAGLKLLLKIMLGRPACR